MYDLQNDVDQLERLVKSKTDQVEPLIAVLDSLATALRNETLRIPASSTQLPLLLTTLLNLKAGLRAPEVVLQAGRVAANLAAECDEARTALAQAEYPRSAVKALKHFGTIKSLVISLLNLAVDRHEDVVACLSDWEYLEPLIHLASTTEEDDIRVWLWTIVDAVVTEDQSLSPVPSTTWADFETAIKGIEHTKESYKAAILSLQILSELSQSEGLSPPSSLLLDIAVLAEKNLDEEISSSKELSANCRGALVDLSCNEKYDPSAPLWQKMRSWVESSKEDLQSSALLIVGNSARHGSARELLELLPQLLPLLRPETSDVVQHGLIGLLRNLSVLERNRQKLFDAGVLDRLIEMKVWSRERERMGSVQGGAIVIAKNLCRDATISNSFLPQGQEPLLDLIGRTDEAPLKWEATRVFVNMIRSLAKENDLAGIDDRVVPALVDMLKQEGQHALLINEAIIALVLLAASKPVLVREHVDTVSSSGSARQVLDEIATDRPGIAEEVRVNARTLISRLNDQS